MSIFREHNATRTSSLRERSVKRLTLVASRARYDKKKKTLRDYQSRARGRKLLGQRTQLTGKTSFELTLSKKETGADEPGSQRRGGRYQTVRLREENVPLGPRAAERESERVWRKMEEKKKGSTTLLSCLSERRKAAEGGVIT